MYVTLLLWTRWTDPIRARFDVVRTHPQVHKSALDPNRAYSVCIQMSGIYLHWTSSCWPRKQNARQTTANRMTIKQKKYQFKFAAHDTHTHSVLSSCHMHKQTHKQLFRHNTHIYNIQRSAIVAARSSISAVEQLVVTHKVTHIRCGIRNDPERTLTQNDVSICRYCF